MLATSLTIAGQIPPKPIEQLKAEAIDRYAKIFHDLALAETWVNHRLQVFGVASFTVTEPGVYEVSGMISAGEVIHKSWQAIKQHDRRFAKPSTAIVVNDRIVSIV
jgi:hypothetical protein